MEPVEVPQTLEYRGDQLNAAPVLEVENFTDWKKRFMCHIIGIEPQFENIIKNGPFIPMTTSQRKLENQWTGDERKAANLDQRLKSLIMSVLPDDQMNSVINCLTAKSTWDDLHYSPDDEEDTRSSHEYPCWDKRLFEVNYSLRVNGIFAVMQIHMKAGTTSTTLGARLPILNLGEYDLWLKRIEQYFLMTHYPLWDVILNGNKVLKRNVGEVEQEYEPTSAKEKHDRRNEMKARGTLLMALLNKDQLKFHSFKDAKLLMEAIEKSPIPSTCTEVSEPINPDDLEELDLQWDNDHADNRARRFIKRTCRKLDVNGQRVWILTGLRYNAASPAVESFVNSSEMLENQEYNKFKYDKGYHAVPPPFHRDYPLEDPCKPDLMSMDENSLKVKYGLLLLC
ncbi:hypothetical protein Tco_0449480 [Tanacetum coccineum]